MSAYEDDPYDSRRHRAPPPSSYRSKPSRTPRDRDRYDADDSDEDDKARAQEVYAAFVRKLIPWLTLRTSAGELFDIDTALRPDGASGMLVSSIAAFERYQSEAAWIWEHQALTRARDAVLATFAEADRRTSLASEQVPA